MSGSQTESATHLIVAEPFQWDKLGCSRSAMYVDKRSTYRIHEHAVDARRRHGECILLPLRRGDRHKHKPC